MSAPPEENFRPPDKNVTEEGHFCNFWRDIFDTHNNIKNNINNNNGFANVKTVCFSDEKIEIYDITEKS